jgi:hypothetical protein
MGVKIFGISLGTIIFVAAIVFIVRKWGNAIPLVNQV